MKGLEAIKEKIIAQAKQKADEILKDAAAHSDGIILSAERWADEYLKKSADGNAADIAAITAREESMARSESRKIVLQAKQDIIEEVIGSSVRTLIELDEPEKEKLYTSVLGRIAQQGDRVIFSKNDKSLAEKIKKESDRQIAVEDDYGDFSGGFMIIRDMIEIDMTFDTIVSQNKTLLIAQTASILFEGNDR